MTNPRVNSQFVIATLAEFVRVWDLGEDASLHLETTKGHATVAFNCKLGPPSAPHPIPTFPPPPPPPWRSRHHRGPAQREKNRQRAACYQASKRAAATAVTSPTTLPTSASVVATSTPIHHNPVYPVPSYHCSSEAFPRHCSSCFSYIKYNLLCCFSSFTPSTPYQFWIWLGAS